MADSSIEWTDKTWNPVTGCSKVSPGCAHCYAEALTMRYAKTWKVPGLPWTPENAEQNVILKPERLTQPLKWKTPSRVFVNSMSDLFHELVPQDYIHQCFQIMERAEQHTFQILTKRPERARDVLLWLYACNWCDGVEDCHVCEDRGSRSHDPLPNVWIGTSIENRRFVHRADTLREVPAAVRFISAEPLLGPLVPDADHCTDNEHETYPLHDAPMHAWRPWADGYQGPGLSLEEIDWLIVGGESGKGHRPFDWDWARELRDYCRDECWQGEREGSTVFFLKQGGGHRPGDRMEDLPEDLRIREYPEAGVPA